MSPSIGRKISPLPTISRCSRKLRVTTFLLILVFIVIIPYVVANWNPYEVLGVPKDASTDEIKKAYRELARKLHPDKSNQAEEDSGKRFIELNKAFNILKDPVRRGRFDQHGETEENRHSRGYHHGSYQHQNRQTREYFAHREFRTFTFTPGSGGNLRKKSITSRQYYNEYLRESNYRPFLIFFYSDICPSCDIIEPIWTKITDELVKYNVRSLTINVYQEPRLSHELGVNSIPYIACLIDGQIHPYHLNEISLTSVVKLIKNQLPNNLVPLLEAEHDQDRFISSSVQANRLSAVIFSDDKNLKLRYKLLAFEFRHNYRFGHVSRRLPDFTLFAKQYNLTGSASSHILVFDEQIKRPTLHFKFHQDNFDFNNLKKQLTNWPYLKLPRLSSQQKFDDLCLYAIPKDGDKVTRSRLCVILFTNETPSFDPVRKKMIEFIEMNNLDHDDKVVFVYINSNKQSEFVQSLLAETQNKLPNITETNLNSCILLIERHPQSNRKALYKWLSSKWDPSRPDELDRSKIELYQYVSGYKKGLFSPEHKVLISLLNDEEGLGLLERVFLRLVSYVRGASYLVTSKESFFTLLVLVVCALSLTSLYNFQVSTQLPDACPGSAEDYIRKQPADSSDTRTYPTHVSSAPSSEDNLKILELKAETYNGMVRLLKPGYRSIILLIDSQTKDKLLPSFKKAVWPYRRNKTLLFGYLCLDKNLRWYKNLLEEILGVENLHVNKNNCIGTVLSLNGFKKYLRVYHAKHHEIDQYDDETDNSGSFLGFNDEEPNEPADNNDMEVGSRTSGEVPYTIDNLLDRLPIWLDKVFDGLTKRYFLDNWPETMN